MEIVLVVDEHSKKAFYTFFLLIDISKIKVFLIEEDS